jgi:peptide methionine sulfoxide reductase MsrB
VCCCALHCCDATDKTTGKYVGGHERHRQMRGTFECACCGAPLFPGDARYDSGTGCASSA